MPCSWIQKQLPAFCGREGSRLIRWAVQRHLRRCPACRAMEKELVSVSRTAARILREQQQNLPETDLWPDLVYHLTREPDAGYECVPDKRFSVAWLRLAVLALGAAAIVFVFLFQGERKSKQMKGTDAGLWSDVPAVEAVHTPNTTVMTFQTGDPGVQIVWFFKENSKSGKGV